MAAILELVLNESVLVHEVIAWLRIEKDEANISEELNGLGKVRYDFVPSFLNYLRDETLHLVHCSKSSLISPSKTPTGIKLSRQNSLSKKNEQVKKERKTPSNTSKRVQLFRSPVNSSTNDLEVSPLAGKCMPSDSPFSGTFNKSSPPHNVSEKSSQRFMHSSTPEHSRLQYKHSLSDYFVTPDNMQYKKKSPFSTNSRRDRFGDNSPSPQMGRRSGGKGKNAHNKLKSRTESPPVLNLNNIEDFPPVGPSSGKKREPSRRITPTPVNHTRSNDSFTAGNLSGISAQDDIKLLKEELAKSKAESSLCFTVPPPTTPTKLKLERLQSLSEITHAERSKVTHERELNLLASLYSALIEANLVPNVTIELYFMIQLLTSRGVSPEFELDTNSRDSDEINYLSTLHNVVYFTVTVLQKQLRIVALLDKGTLRLLADSLRVVDFSDTLKKKLTELHESACLKHVSAIPNTSFGSVSFQADTDNRNNFPNDRSFQVFKKQRDLFYEILREWKEKHQSAGWSMIEAMGERIQSLVSHRAELANYLHLARLFQAQLISMCKDGCQQNGDSEEEKITLLSQLKKSNPDKFKKLEDRFSAPSSSKGPCPPVSFPGCQEFFRDFILAAANPILNQHLMDSFSVKIMELNDTQFVPPESQSDVNDQRECYASCVLTLRLLAKFLGFLVFLPYQTAERPPDMMEATCLLIRDKSVPPLDVCECLRLSCLDHRTCLTVPWLVEFISMMDLVASGLRYYKSVLVLLVQIYRRRGSLLFHQDQDYASLLLVLMLGWLFQTPAFPEELFFTENASTLMVPPPSGSLDSLHLVDQQLVYTCCPYLSEVRTLLVEFAVGMSSRVSGVRKIKPISADGVEAQSMADCQIQLRLEENFFHNHPSSLRRNVDFVAEQVASNFIRRLRAEVIGPAKKDSLQKVIFVAQNHVAGSPVNKSKTANDLHLIASEICKKTKQYSQEHCASYCSAKVIDILSLILPEDMTSNVISTASMISGRIALDKVQAWISSHASSASFIKDLQSEFDKQLKQMTSTSHNASLPAGNINMGSPSLTLPTNLSTVSLDSITEQPSLNQSSSVVDVKNREQVGSYDSADVSLIKPKDRKLSDESLGSLTSCGKASTATKPSRRVNLITLSSDVSSLEAPILYDNAETCDKGSSSVKSPRRVHLITLSGEVCSQRANDHGTRQFESGGFDVRNVRAESNNNSVCDINNFELCNNKNDDIVMSVAMATNDDYTNDNMSLVDKKVDSCDKSSNMLPLRGGEWGSDSYALDTGGVGCQVNCGASGTVAEDGDRQQECIISDHVPSKVLSNLKDLVNAIVTDSDTRCTEVIRSVLKEVSLVLKYDKDLLSPMKKNLAQLTIDLVCSLVLHHDDCTLIFHDAFSIWTPETTLDDLLCPRQIWNLQRLAHNEVAWNNFRELLKGILHQQIMDVASARHLLDAAKQQSWCAQVTVEKLNDLMEVVSNWATKST